CSFVGSVRCVYETVPLLLGALLLTSAMSMLDQSIVATAGPSLAADLGAMHLYSWTFTAYMLTFAMAMPVYGKLGDLLGRRSVYLAAIALFVLGSVACGMATSMEQLIVFRALQGLGGGGLQVGAFAVLGDLLPPRQRAHYQGWFAGVMIIANLSGPPVGGLLTDLLGWQWIFYVNVPIGIVAFIGLRLLLPAGPRADSRPPFDLPGLALLTGLICCLVLLTDLAGRHGWAHPAVLPLAITAAPALLLWLRVERRASDPAVPLDLFSRRPFAIAVAVAFAVSFAFFGCVSFVPLFLQMAAGVSPTGTGLLFLPAMAGMALATMLVGRSIGRSGRYKWFPVIGTALALVATGTLALASPDTGLPFIGLLLTVLGIGVGMSSQVTTVIAQSAAPRRHMGVSTSTVGLARNLGVAFGVAVLGALVNARITAEAAHRLPSELADRILSGHLSPGEVSGLGARETAAVAEVYGEALSSAFLAACPLLLAALVLALLLPDERLAARGPGGAGRASRP
ncbi:MDR family MFS transporter, partial [Streptomyces calidiresistens]